jgi:hypothetical protein
MLNVSSAGWVGVHTKLRVVVVCAVYQQHKDKDGFLYITYSGESAFG